MTGRSAPTSTNLRDDRAFPSFMECPYEHDIPYAYYREREEGVYAPIRHWCYLGEITEKAVFTRLCLTVEDKRGDEVTTSFYLDSHHSGGTFLIRTSESNLPVHRNMPNSLIKEGNTIAILYAQQHGFADGNIGFRIEDAERVQFFPCTLERLLALSDRISNGLSHTDDVPACTKCNTTAIPRQRCSRCHVTWYCGKDCQVGDWSDHKKDCKLLNQVAALMRQDWEHFDKYYLFPLPVE
ncbi:hypothetical protein EDB86DRAFT_1989300 [Lactarius hatsudake]|nr:hypothetical protein EDB86DRAFT_1989300 [Lactarius hatsudake]